MPLHPKIRAALFTALAAAIATIVAAVADVYPDHPATAIATPGMCLRAISDLTKRSIVSVAAHATSARAACAGTAPNGITATKRRAVAARTITGEARMERSGWDGVVDYILP